MESVFSAIDDVINCITSSKEYKNCIFLQNKMKNNQEIMDLILQVKKLQKKYIRSEYDSKIKKELDECTKSLMNIPLYYEYQLSLERVNEMIGYVKESLNDYFYNILN